MIVHQIAESTKDLQSRKTHDAMLLKFCQTVHQTP